jgi:hypothetical protein
MRSQMVRGFGAVAFALLTGCDCREKMEVIETIYAHGTAEIVAEIVQGYERQGYSCTSESIRNGFGNSIGRKYTCTKCD